MDAVRFQHKITKNLIDSIEQSSTHKNHARSWNENSNQLNTYTRVIAKTNFFLALNIPKFSLLLASFVLLLAWCATLYKALMNAQSIIAMTTSKVAHFFLRCYSILFFNHTKKIANGIRPFKINIWWFNTLQNIEQCSLFSFLFLFLTIFPRKVARSSHPIHFLIYQEYSKLLFTGERCDVKNHRIGVYRQPMEGRKSWTQFS